MCTEPFQSMSRHIISVKGHGLYSTVYGRQCTTNSSTEHTCPAFRCGHTMSLFSFSIRARSECHSLAESEYWFLGECKQWAYTVMAIYSANIHRLRQSFIGMSALSSGRLQEQCITPGYMWITWMHCLLTVKYQQPECKQQMWMCAVFMHCPVLNANSMRLPEDQVWAVSI